MYTVRQAKSLSESPGNEISWIKKDWYRAQKTLILFFTLQVWQI